MVPLPLVGRYKLYKKGTKQLVNWLAKIGSRCCDLKKVLKSMNCGLPNSKKQTSKDFMEVEVGTRELIKLAEAISGSDPPTDVPEEIILIARAVIKGREECANWYAAQALAGDGKLQQENDNHQYFITVLRRVLALLTEARDKLHPPENEPARLIEKKSKKSKSKSSVPSQQSRDDKLGNLFDLLQVEEPSTSPLGDEPPPPYQAVAAASVSQFSFKIEKDNADPAFATWCFLQDLNDCRLFVKSTWQEYSRGEISFLAASSVTDVAFGLMRCADENFCREKSGCPTTDWKELIHWLGLTWFSRNNTVWLCPATIGSQPSIPDSDVNIVEILSPVAILCLHSYSQDFKEVCEAIRDKKPVPEKCADGHLHRFHEFCCVLFKLAPEVHSISDHGTCKHLVVDEFVQGLAQMHRDGKTPMWIVVALQCYLDIKDLLGPHISHGVEALEDTLKKNRDLRDQVHAYSEECGDDFADVRPAMEKLDWAANAYSRFDQSVLCESFGQKAAKKYHIKKELGCSAGLLERELPAHAGATLADLKFGMLDAGCQIANHGFIVLSAAHLYKALRATGMLGCDWPDMDFVLSSLKGKKPLVAKLSPSHDGDLAARHYLLALGLQSKDLTNSRRMGKMMLKNARKMTISSPFLQKMSDRQQAWQKHGIGYSKSKTMEVVLQTLAPSIKSTDSSTMDSRSRLQTSFTPLQLMSTYKRILLADEPQLNFDYIGFTIAAARLLNSLSRQIGPKLGLKDWAKGKLGLKPGETIGSTHVDLVYRLLRTSPDNSDISEASSLFNDYIVSSGKSFLKQAHDQSSGRIPKDLRPKIVIDHAKIEKDRAFLSTMLTYSNTKYMFSGKTMAAYHPKVKPELCQADCCGQLPPGGDTEPGKGYGEFFGAAIPDHILDEGSTNQMLAFRASVDLERSTNEAAFKAYAAGQISETEVKKRVKMYMGYPIEPMAPNEFRQPCTPWVYIAIPDEKELPLYDEIYWNILVQNRCLPQVYGGPLRVPVDLMDAEITRAMAGLDQNDAHLYEPSGTSPARYS